MKDEELIQRRQQAEAGEQGPSQTTGPNHHAGLARRAAPGDRPVEMMHILAELGRLRRRIIELENNVRLHRMLN